MTTEERKENLRRVEAFTYAAIQRLQQSLTLPPAYKRAEQRMARTLLEHADHVLMHVEGADADDDVNRLLRQTETVGSA